MSEATLDTRGLNCPLPVLKARKRLMAMRPGDRLVVLASDPKAPGDLALFAGDEAVAALLAEEGDGAYRIVLERA
jgi:tRNA 2-thiouridine synthesizing protein A